MHVSPETFEALTIALQALRREVERLEAEKRAEVERLQAEVKYEQDQAQYERQENRRLYRERDEAREQIEAWRKRHEEVITRLQKERDEAIETVRRYEAEVKARGTSLWPLTK